MAVEGAAHMIASTRSKIRAAVSRTLAISAPFSNADSNLARRNNESMRKLKRARAGNLLHNVGNEKLQVDRTIDCRRSRRRRTFGSRTIHIYAAHRIGASNERSAESG